jgi:hypothetical protein
MFISADAASFSVIELPDRELPPAAMHFARVRDNGERIMKSLMPYGWRTWQRSTHEMPNLPHGETRPGHCSTCVRHDDRFGSAGAGVRELRRSLPLKPTVALLKQAEQAEAAGVEIDVRRFAVAA